MVIRTRGWAVVVCVAWTVACGGSVTSANSDGGPTGGGCPATQPANGTPCVGSIECEYPRGPEFCAIVVLCQGQRFEEQKPVCSPNAPSCPPDFASVPRGGACNPSIAPTCDYSDGRCGCSPPVSGPPQVDAGVTWHCTSSTPDCPALRPRLGTPCAKAGQVCDYGSCTVPNDYGNVGTSPMAVECKGTAWVRAVVGCPL